EDMELKVFEAASRALVATGKPIITHTTIGNLGLEKIEIFKKFNVDLSKVTLSHLDLSGDLVYMFRVLDTGVNIAFDTIGKNNYQPAEERANWLKELCNRGYSNQIVMSM
ncbi:phosphotriesterase-related protein, partial [Clostridium sp. HCS.1]